VILGVPGEAAPALAARGRERHGMSRFGSGAARAGWGLAAVVLVGLGGLQLLTAVRAALALPRAGGSAGGVVAAVALVVLLIAGGLTCLVCAPGCAARVVRRRVPARPSRHRRVLRSAETAVRVLTGACLLTAALVAHGSGHLPAALRTGAGPTLSGVALHPGALLVVGVAAATLSRRWSRALARGAGSPRRS